MIWQPQMTSGKPEPGSFPGRRWERGRVDMLYLPDGREIRLDYIDWNKTEQSNKDGVTIVLQDTMTSRLNCVGASTISKPLPMTP